MIELPNASLFPAQRRRLLPRSDRFTSWREFGKSAGQCGATPPSLLEWRAGRNDTRKELLKLKGSHPPLGIRVSVSSRREACAAASAISVPLQKLAFETGFPAVIRGFSQSGKRALRHTWQLRRRTNPHKNIAGSSRLHRRGGAVRISPGGGSRSKSIWPGLLRHWGLAFDGVLKPVLEGAALKSIHGA